jgi:hypothetical protein
MHQAAPERDIQVYQWVNAPNGAPGRDDGWTPRLGRHGRSARLPRSRAADQRGQMPEMVSVRVRTGSGLKQVVSRVMKDFRSRG